MLVAATCRANPGPGCWSWVTKDGRSASRGVPATTRRRAGDISAVAARAAIALCSTKAELPGRCDESGPNASGQALLIVWLAECPVDVTAVEVNPHDDAFVTVKCSVD
jgi:hypothetical protein